jgi:hypothetical protein
VASPDNWRAMTFDAKACHCKILRHLDGPESGAVRVFSPFHSGTCGNMTWIVLMDVLSLPVSSGWSPWSHSVPCGKAKLIFFKKMCYYYVEK